MHATKPCILISNLSLSFPSLFLLSVSLVVFEMGICSSQMSRKNGNILSLRPSIMVIDLQGGLQEFNQPIRASGVLSQHPNSFLCSSETMYVDSVVLKIPQYEELEIGQIYFLLPISQSHKLLSLQDLCGLAIKASFALGFDFSTTPKANTYIKRMPSNTAKLLSQCKLVLRVES